MEKMGYNLALSYQVSQLVKDGVFSEILRLVQEDIDLEWKRTPPQEVQTREQLYHESHALSRIHIKVETLIQSLRLEESNNA